MIVDSIKQTLMITSFVMVMMLIIEYFNVRTKGGWSKGLQASKFSQILFSVILAIIPGCLGTFAVVSLFTHRIITFGALLAALIATTGDESFVMFSLIPATALKINIILIASAFVIGYAVDTIFKNPYYKGVHENHFQLHSEDNISVYNNSKNLLNSWKNISFERAILVFGLLLFIFALLFGFFNHDDSHNHLQIAVPNEWGWMKVTFIIGSLIALLIVSAVPEHFLEHHLWEHIIKKHFPRIFLWTLGALLLIAFLLQNVSIENWLRTNHLSVLFIALIIGIIPISGPHIIFITLFISGAVPFSILLANSFVQDGHGALPLFAETKKNFLLSKLIKLSVALIIGLAGYWLGF
jgi:hypothetical protein